MNAHGQSHSKHEQVTFAYQPDTHFYTAPGQESSPIKYVRSEVSSPHQHTVATRYAPHVTSTYQPLAQID